MSFKKIFFLFTASMLIAAFSGNDLVADIPQGNPLVLGGPDFAPLFPFKIEKGAPDNITNVQTWEGKWARAGSDGMMKVVDGQFVDTSGKEHFFFGSNLCFSGNFPTKENAELLASTLACFGVNIIRLHHMDDRHIWGANFNRTKTEIDPEQLDRLDYLIDQLQKNGVYVNINLHVSRKFDERDQFVNAQELPEQCKGVDNFDPRMIELQKKYAKDLLTHINPYTKKAYINDPGIAMIEINNENSVVASWFWGELDKLPSPYCDTFRELWNNWLLQKYASTKELRKSWDCKNIPLGQEQITNGKFNADSAKNIFRENWEIQRDNVSVDKTDFYQADKIGQYALRIAVEKLGNLRWIPQIHRTGLAVKEGTIYTLSFKAKAETPVSVSTGVLENHDPWGDCGLRTKIDLTGEWKTFSYTFMSGATDDNARVTFSELAPGNSYEFADVSLCEGGMVGFDETYTLESKTIPVPKSREKGALVIAKEMKADWCSFLRELEDGYWQEMFRYVKEELKAKPPVSGTQLQYGFWYAQAKLDYCDIHAYWNHPNFPRRSWDQNDWYIGSQSLANGINHSSATLPNLAMARVIDRPLTVSEYDHPYPNLYCAEGNPMIAAFGAFQNWSAVYQFAWSHSDNYDPDSATTFFDLCGNQAKLAHFPACYAMFTRGDVQRGPGKFIYAPEMSDKKELELMQNGSNDYHRSLSGLDIDNSLTLAVFSGVSLIDIDKKIDFKNFNKINSWKEIPESLGSPEKRSIQNEFHQILWDFQDEGAGYFQVDTPRTKVFSGFVRNRSFNFDGLTIKPGKTQLDWTTISFVQCDNADNPGQLNNKEKILSPGRYLLTATGVVQNTNARIVSVGEDQISTAKAFGGSPGTAPVLCEGIPMELQFKGIAPDRITAWSLDQRGDRVSEIKPTRDESGNAVLHVGPEYKTLRYELNIF